MSTSYPVIDDLGESDKIQVSGYSPFDDSNPGADVILHISDECDFYTHQFLLSLASPLCIPYHKAKHNDRPLIRLTDDSVSVNLMLRVCDPRHTPKYSTLNDIQLALAVADKYDMVGVKGNVIGALLLQQHLIESESLQVFTTGVRYQLEEVVRRAARETLRFTLEERIEVYIWNYVAESPRALFCMWKSCKIGCNGQEVLLVWYQPVRLFSARGF